MPQVYTLCMMLCGSAGRMCVRAVCTRAYGVLCFSVRIRSSFYSMSEAATEGLCTASAYSVRLFSLVKSVCWLVVVIGFC